MSPPLHNTHPVTRLPPAPPGYVSFKVQKTGTSGWWLYSRQSSALQNIPTGYSLDDALERLDTHTAMHDTWLHHCHH
ncbi:hypothetical protein C8F04DRAFT_1265737 [Mycena alexandri]|uniref:Uncharacterized protein n=1 Tax=Mycena alexandri TaxID=1745969 RepID=A0AAD6WVE9_9AGAR|nr:hypothetical protein C8F04DRAFT_1265737 [Mycena alexandri]